MSVAIKAEMTAGLRRLMDVGPRTLVRRSLGRSMARALNRLERVHKTRYMYPAAGRRGRSGKLAIRSGDLRDSYRTAKIKFIRAGAVEGVYGSGSRYARIHEKGGLISAAPGKYLAIPLRDGLPSAGSLRADKSTFVRRSKAGNLLIFKRNSDKSIVPLYLLRNKVRIPHRATAQLALAASMKDIERIIRGDMRKTLFGGSSNG